MGQLGLVVQYLEISNIQKDDMHSETSTNTFHLKNSIMGLNMPYTELLILKLTQLFVKNITDPSGV